MFYNSSLLHNFLISRFRNKVLIWKLRILGFFDLLEPNFFKLVTVVKGGLFLKAFLSIWTINIFHAHHIPMWWIDALFTWGFTTDLLKIFFFTMTSKMLCPLLLKKLSLKLFFWQKNEFSAEIVELLVCIYDVNIFLSLRVIKKKSFVPNRIFSVNAAELLCSVQTSAGDFYIKRRGDKKKLSSRKSKNPTMLNFVIKTLLLSLEIKKLCSKLDL